MIGYWRRVGELQRNVRFYLLCTVFYSVTIGFSSLLFNLYLIELGLDVAFIGLNTAMLSLASIVCAVPAGVLADRIGRKRAILIGLSGMVLAQLGLALFRQGALLLCASLFSGIFSTLLLTSSAPFLTENSTAEQRSMVFTLHAGLMNLSSFAAVIGGGYLPRLFARLLHVGPESAPAYRGVILTAAGIMALALLPALALRQPDRPGALHRARASIRLFSFSKPRLMFQLVLPRLLMALGAGLVFPFLNLFFKQRFAISDAVLGWIFGITDLTAAVVMLWGGDIADRLGKARSAFFAPLLSVPGLIVMGFVPLLPVVVLAHWTRSGLMRLGESLYMAFTMDKLDEGERATGSSLMATGWNVGWSAASYFSGRVQARTGWGLLFSTMALFYLLGLAFLYLFFIRRPRVGAVAGQESGADDRQGIDF